MQIRRSTSRSVRSTASTAPDEFNAGERIYTGRTSLAAAVREHVARYEFAVDAIGRGGVVVDAACGSGYGSQMLANRARQVVALDVSESALNYAARVHAAANLSYLRADFANGMPLRSEVADSVVSFETIEHVVNPAHLISEYARVLRPGGKLILSTPDRRVYTELNGYSNQFHRVEFSKPELVELVCGPFQIEAMFGQKRWTGFRWVGPIKRALRRRLPPRLLAAVMAGDSAVGRIAARASAIEDDSRLQRISDRSPNLFFYLVIVARK
jgi:SAM-dependent methyltransferase